LGAVEKIFVQRWLSPLEKKSPVRLWLSSFVSIHECSAYSFYYPRITVIELSPLYPVKIRYGKVFPTWLLFSHCSVRSLPTVEWFELHGIVIIFTVLTVFFSGILAPRYTVTSALLHSIITFLRTMHYSAKRGLAIACRPSVW